MSSQHSPRERRVANPRGPATVGGFPAPVWLARAHCNLAGGPCVETVGRGREPLYFLTLI